MRIVVNTRLLIKNKLEGIGWFTHETLKRITQKHPEHQFVFLFDRPFDESFIYSDNVTPIIISPQARHPALFYVWFEYSVAAVLKNLKPDLFLSPDGYLSLSSDTPSLPVIHDLNFAHYPQDLPFLVRKYYNYFFPKFAKKAVRIATVSEYSKNDIVTTYHIPPDNIDVVYNGVNELFTPVDENTQQRVRERFSFSKKYFLFVGSLHPRKNIVRLFKAFDLFRMNKDIDVKLMVVGEKYWWTGEIEKTYEQMQSKKDVIFTGRLSTEDLKDVMASALALTYVPYFEGFGIPILEAMKSGIPVITSDITSMPEVGGGAALYADPFSAESIKEAMEKIATDASLRKMLIGKGHERANEFSWDRTSSLLWSSVEKTVDA